MTARPGRAVTFDLDGTLVRSAFEHWVIPEIAARIASSHRSADVARALVRRHLKALDRGEALLAYNWQAHADALAVEAGLPPGTVDVAEVVRRHSEPGKVRLLHDDALATLRELRDRGWRVGVLTNGFRDYQEPVLRATGLDDVVDFVVTTDDVGHAKPDARALAAALGASRPAVHVGDRLDHDVQGANRAGASSVLLQPDVPITGHTAQLDAADRHRLHEYLASLAGNQGVLAPGGRLPVDMVPDVVAADITALAELLEELALPARGNPETSSHPEHPPAT